MSSNTSGSARPARGLPTPEIDLASAFQPSTAVDHTKGLGGMSRRRSARTADSSTAETGAGAEEVGTTAATAGERTSSMQRRQQADPTAAARLEVVEPLDQPGEQDDLPEGETQVEEGADIAQDPAARGSGAPVAPPRSAPSPRTRRTGAVAAGEGGTSRSARGASSTSSARRTAAEETKASGRPAATKGGVAYVPAATRDLLARLRGDRGRTLGELVLNALNAQHAQLAELVQQRRPQVVEGPLFSMAAAPTRVLTVQIALRLSQAHWDVLDALVEQYGAANRGELIDAAVQAEYGSTEA